MMALAAHNFSRSKIDKLSIRGIRSFDNAQPEIIQFSTPLTLIVGYNGSGKTVCDCMSKENNFKADVIYKTIIESLKYATTGDMPPNAKQGGAFIHDPKLCGEKEVLAQVKLQFRDPSGAKLVVTRNVSLTVQKTKRVMKTLDGSLLRHANGERIVMSSRNAELDRFVPQYLGVSKAVLDNVIFCHQDESLWPMSEPNNLKKKFDEIFEALKYTKAIEAIKKMRKDYMDELKRLQLTEQHCKENKSKADKVSQESSRISDDIERLRVEVENLDRLTREAKEKHQAAWERSTKFKEILRSLDTYRERQQWLRDKTEALTRELKIRPEPDEWLRNELDQYDERVRLRADQKETQTNKFNQLKHAIENTRIRLQGKHTEVGKCEQQQDRHDQDVEARNDLIKQSAARHNIRGYETDLDDMQINEYMEKVSNLYKGQLEKVERARRETDNEKQKVQEVLSKLGERRSGLQEQQSSARQQSSANDRRIRLFQSEIDSIEVDEGAKALSESKVQEINESLKQAREEFRLSSWDAEIQNVKLQLQNVEDQVGRGNQELVRGTKQSKDLARLEVLRKELGDRKRGLETLREAHNERLRKVIGDDWDLASLERDFQTVTDQRSRKLEDAKNLRNAASRDLGQMEDKLGSLRGELKKAEKELRECEEIIVEATDEQPGNYLSSLDELQRNRDTQKGDVEDFSINRRLYSISISTAEKNSRCYLCKRGFHDEPEKSDFLKRMEKKLEENTQKQMEEDLKIIEEDLSKSRSVGPKHSLWLHLSNSEIPRLRSEIRRLEESKPALVRKSEDHDKEVADQEDSSRDAESLSKPIASILRFQSEIATYTEQTSSLSAAQHDAGVTRPVDEVQEQLESLNAQARTKNTLIAKLTAERQRALDNIRSKELDLSKAETNLGTATHQLEKRSSLAKQIEDLRTSNRESRDTVRRLDDLLQALSPRFSEEETKLDDIKTRGHRKEQELHQEASKLSDSLKGLRAAEQSIQAFKDSGGPLRLNRCQREIRDLKREIEQTEAEQKETIKEINTINDELRNHQDTRRTITDNLTYRQSKRELEDIDKEVTRLSAENAEADVKRFKDQEQYWENQFHKHSTEKTSRFATMKAKDDQLQKLLQDWQTDYQNSAQEYKEAHIKVETTKAAVEDLGRYGSALDKAIMQFHSLKMEEINRVAEELWKKTYQGTDIDSILIRSDNETGKGNRSYNYRVCMVKQDTEMDMRGRCSAGQRVLASIIIRLALAECFGVKCGLIALDEPTTNLDSDNIRSLAESLHDIIRARQQQSNFQLIVITHDEEFLNHMQCDDFCDTYFRVSRTDRQKSKIERQLITEIANG
ncbi:MAG: hypothetical protein Q9223_001446 [Gallowayella weberi]